MTKYREILRLSSLGLSQQNIADSCKSLQRIDRGAGWPLAVEAGEAVCQLRSADYR